MEPRGAAGAPQTRAAPPAGRADAPTTGALLLVLLEGCEHHWWGPSESHSSLSRAAGASAGEGWGGAGQE